MKPISYIFLVVAVFGVGTAVTVAWYINRDLPQISTPSSYPVHGEHGDPEWNLTPKQLELWHRDLATQFKEPALNSLGNEVESRYRLVLMPSFDKPVVVRVWRSGNQSFLISKRTDVKGVVDETNSRSLSEDEWKGFINLLKRVDFFGTPARINEDPMPDGATWTLEGSSNGLYRNVQRIAPTKDFEESCTYLLRLAGFLHEYDGYLLN